LLPDRLGRGHSGNSTVGQATTVRFPERILLEHSLKFALARECDELDWLPASIADYSITITDQSSVISHQSSIINQ